MKFDFRDYVHLVMKPDVGNQVNLENCQMC